MVCWNCQKEIPNGSAFCNHCGVKQLENGQSGENQEIKHCMCGLKEDQDPKQSNDNNRSLAKTVLISFLAILIVGCIAGGLGHHKFIEIKYQNALSDFDNKDYASAKSTFELLGDYKLSKEMKEASDLAMEMERIVRDIELETDQFSNTDNFNIPEICDLLESSSRYTALQDEQADLVSHINDAVTYILDNGKEQNYDIEQLIKVLSNYQEIDKLTLKLQEEH